MASRILNQSEEEVVDIPLENTYAICQSQSLILIIKVTPGETSEETPPPSRRPTKEEKDMKISKAQKKDPTAAATSERGIETLVGSAGNRGTRPPRVNGGWWSKLVLFGCCALAGTRLAGATLVLTGARIIDGTGGASLENEVVVFDGKQILEIGPADKVQVPPGAEVIDVQGKSIIPALISVHSHLGLCQGALGPKPENYTHENVQHQLEQYERYGVLTVMSLGVNKDNL